MAYADYDLRDPTDPGDLDLHLRNYDTPDAMIQKSHADARGLAEDIMDMEIYLIEELPRVLAGGTQYIMKI